MSIETFNISFESTQSKQQYGTKITCTEARKKVMVIRNVIKKNWKQFGGCISRLEFVPTTSSQRGGGGNKVQQVGNCSPNNGTFASFSIQGFWVRLCPLSEVDCACSIC